MEVAPSISKKNIDKYKTTKKLHVVWRYKKVVLSRAGAATSPVEGGAACKS